MFFIKGYVPPAGFPDTFLWTVSDFIGQHPMYFYKVEPKKMFQNSLHIQGRSLMLYQNIIAYSDHNAWDKINIVPVIISQQMFVGTNIHILFHRQQIIAVIIKQRFQKPHKTACFFIFNQFKSSTSNSFSFYSTFDGGELVEAFPYLHNILTAACIKLPFFFFRTICKHFR